MDLMPFHTFISNLDEEAEGTLSKVADDTKPGEVADTTEDCGAVQMDPDRLEKWAETPTHTPIQSIQQNAVHNPKTKGNNSRHSYAMYEAWPPDMIYLETFIKSVYSFYIIFSVRLE